MILRRLNHCRSRDTLSAALWSTLVVLVVAPVVGLVLAVGSHAVPDGRILTGVLNAIDRQEVTEADYGPALTGKRIDYFSDCIGFSIGLTDLGEDSPFRSAIETRTGGGCSDVVPALDRDRRSDRIESGYDYYRYWHGYTVFTRPSIAAFGLAGTRMLALAALGVVVVGFARSLASVHGWLLAGALIGPLLLTTDLLELPRSLPHATGAIAALGGAWYVHRRVSARPSAGEIAWSSAVAGSTFLYFDILTMPPGAAMLVVASAGLAAAQQESGRRLARALAVSLAAWAVAWGVMWVWKWAIAAAVYGASTVIDVIRFTAELRLDGNAQNFDLSFLQSSRVMVDVWTDQPLTVPVMMTTVAVVVGVAAMRVRRGERIDRIGDRVLLALPAGIAFVWFEIMRNHSQNHAFFTYRSVAVAAGVILAAAIVVLPAARPAVEAHDERIAESV